MIRMHCKSNILRHPFTKCHIITLKEMQKKKKKRPSKPTSDVALARPTPAMGLASMSAVGLARPTPAVVWQVRRACWPTALGLAGHDPPRPDSKPAVTRQNPLQNSIIMPQNSLLIPQNSFQMHQNTFLDSNLKPRGKKLTH
jgi:hypothetical protein